MINHFSPNLFSKYFGALFLALLLCGADLRAQFAAPSTGNTTMRQIAKLLICPCADCGKQALDQCPDKCADGKKHRDEIVGLLGENKSQDEILKFFATTYGAQMLGDPPNEGFGALASWVPYGAIIFGLLPLLMVARSRRRRAPVAARKAKGKTPAADDARLAAALRDYDY